MTAGPAPMPGPPAARPSGARPPAASPSGGRSPDGVLVRDAEGDEVDRAGEVVASAYLADGLASERYAARLRASRERADLARLLVAVDADGRVVGTVTYARAGSPMADLCRADPTGGAELRMLGVLPEARGRGVAEALVRWCLGQARADGARRLLLSTQAGMHAAQRLYGRLGFVRRPDLDWTPEPGVWLLGLQLELDGMPVEAPLSD